MTWISRCVWIAVCLTVAGCGNGGTMGPSGPSGQVTGRVTAADGRTGIGGATVALASASTGGPTTTTDMTGAYTLSAVPTGAQNLRARKGNFQATFAVTVRANEVVTAPSAPLVAVGKLAFVPGSFDSIESIVRDQLGNPMDSLSASQLGFASTLSSYRMIFLNCGLDIVPAFTPATITALRNWVEGGGTLYTSDFAVEYAKAMLPNDIQQTEQDTRTQTIAASVVDSGLQAFLGKSTVQIRYDLPAWQGLRQISSRPRVLLRGSYTNGGTVVADRPLAIVINQGAGKVVYTTFHNEAGATADQIAVLRYYVYID